ncbi:MAG: dTDP-4-dehydrorhamnose 3,5-epimerase [Hyphomonas sp.]|nr:dTDP-4-dehydrorhamnose 3,5-epimerase [Hyphomonas sp.]
MKFERQALPDVILVTPDRHGDARGFFSETFRANTYESAGIAGPFVQDNHAWSADAGVLRGLHFQVPPKAQAKLIRCTRGAILDVAVDLRRSSPTFGQHVSAQLSAENGQQLFVPEGFAHGYLTLTPDCVVVYKMTEYYAPEAEGGLAWDDPDLGIDWPLKDARPTLSTKDAELPGLASFDSPFE